MTPLSIILATLLVVMTGLTWAMERATIAYISRSARNRAELLDHVIPLLEDLRRIAPEKEEMIEIGLAELRESRTRANQMATAASSGMTAFVREVILRGNRLEAY